MVVVVVRGGAHREESGPSCLALSNDLCIMKDGNNISHSLQGSTLWQDLHIHIFFPSPPHLSPPSFFFFPPHCKLFFLWAGHLPPRHCSGRDKINKYVCVERHMIYPDATEIWHDVDIVTYPDRVDFPQLKHQGILFGVSGEEYSLSIKTWQRSGVYICFA